MKNNYLLTIAISVLFFTGFISTQTNAQVVINEYSCSNLTQFVDNHSDYGDWLELYNTSASSVSLSGYYLSDDSINVTKWQFPAGVVIAGNGFLKIWADGRNEVAAGNYHTNFSLTQTKNNSEFVVLSDPGANIVDYRKLSKKTQLGHSWGRTFNGIAAWSIFTSPTPGASNNSATPYFAYADRPDFSMVAGFYPSSIVLAITTTEPNADIHYTLDGTLPSISSPIYTTPLTISATTVVKAITISTDPEILPSFVEFDTYFINVSHTIPVVSISGTQLNTLANGSGSLLPKGSVEYFNASQVRTAHTYGEFNRHGQDSWANSQRSLDFISRDEMGYDHSIEEQLFSLTPRDNFQRVILRAAGDDNYPADHHAANAGSAHLRDAYVHNLAKIGGMDLDVRVGAKAVVYLNGVYWGVYDLREIPDDHDFTKFYYGQDKYHLQYIETWGGTWAEYGGNQALTDWNNFYNYVMAGNMTNPTTWQYVNDRLDVNSLTDYVLVNMFSVCSDWLNYNTGWWRGMDSTGTHLKWGYILWDNDATFGHYINYTGIPNTNTDAQPCDVEGLSGGSDPEGHIMLLNKLRQNPDFDQYYISRQIDLWNTVFSCDNMLQQLDSLTAVIGPEMTMHSNRWAGTYTEWQSNVQLLRNFIIQRCTDLTQGFINCYSLTGPYNLVVNADPVGAGSVQLNSLLLNNLPWSGTYFGGVNTKLTAIANTNYSFANWTANTQVFNPNPLADDVVVNLNGTDSIVAHFILSTSVGEIPGLDPVVYASPTAFTEMTTINYVIPSTGRVSIKLYNMLGEEIAVISDGEKELPAGKYAAQLNLSGSGLNSGLYLLNFNFGGYKKSVKLLYTPQN